MRKRCIYGGFLSCPMFNVDVADVGRPISAVTAKASVKSARDEGTLAKRYDTVTYSPKLRSSLLYTTRTQVPPPSLALHLSCPRCSFLSLRSSGQHLNLWHQKVMRHLCKWHTLRFLLFDELILCYSGARATLPQLVTQPFALLCFVFV